MSSKITSKGQITVPKAVREALAVYAGDRVRFVIHEDSTVTVEADTVDLASLRESISSGGRHITIKQMSEAIARGAVGS